MSISGMVIEVLEAGHNVYIRNGNREVLEAGHNVYIRNGNRSIRSWTQCLYQEW